ncbi:MAG: hypothetical protein H0V35_12975 [Nitrospira sp.]|nr:hypothetical protein [Nitrospira sp.]
MVLTARGEKELAAMHLRAALSDPRREFAGADQAMATLRSIEQSGSTLGALFE